MIIILAFSWIVLGISVCRTDPRPRTLLGMFLDVFITWPRYIIFYRGISKRIDKWEKDRADQQARTLMNIVNVLSEANGGVLK